MNTDQQLRDHAIIRDVYSRFMPIDDQHFAAIVAEVTCTEVPKGSTWMTQGSRNDQLGLLVQGLIAGVEDIDGDEYTTVFFEAPDFVTEYVGFLRQAPARHSLVALENSRVYSWSYEALQRLYTDSPQGDRLGRLIAEWLIAVVVHEVRSFRFETATERYEKLARRHPNLLQRVPQYMIASYLGITPESLSRIRAKLVRG